MLKGTKFYSIARGKCPRCMDGDIYPVNNPYRLKNLTDLNTHCTHCKQNFEPEPNFYYGAMYVSYAYTVALFVAVYVFFGIFLDCLKAERLHAVRSARMSDFGRKDSM